MAVLSQFSLVLEVPPAEPQEASRHFASKLSVETDPSDVMLDLQRGQTGFIVVDVRSTDDFEECHVEGAINFPYRQINAETVTRLPKDKVIVVYCWGPGCNLPQSGTSIEFTWIPSKGNDWRFRILERDGGNLTGKTV